MIERWTRTWSTDLDDVLSELAEGSRSPVEAQCWRILGAIAALPDDRQYGSINGPELSIVVLAAAVTPPGLRAALIRTAEAACLYHLETVLRRRGMDVQRDPEQWEQWYSIRNSLLAGTAHWPQTSQPGDYTYAHLMTPAWAAYDGGNAPGWGEWLASIGWRREG